MRSMATSQAPRSHNPAAEGPRRGHKRAYGRALSAARTVLPLLGRAYPLASGRARIANSPKLNPLFAGMPDEMIVRSGGSRMVVRPDDYVGRAVILFGNLDAKVTWVVDRVLRQGDNMLDIGANVGLVSLRAAQRVRAGHVHAVEPQERLVQYGRRSAALNGYQSLTFHPLALSDQPGRMTLRVPNGNYGAASLERDLPDEHSTVQTVPVLNTSAFVQSLDVGSWRLWKIDVEGHEAAVLRGAVDCFSEHWRPDVIVCEEQAPPESAESIEILRSCGYEMYSLPRTLLRPRLEPLGRTAGNDYVAVSRARHADVGPRLGL